MRSLNDYMIEFVTVTASQTSDAIDLQTCILADLTATITGSNPANTTFVDGDVSTVTDLITKASHGYTTGMKVTELTTTGVLPSGLALLTEYYIYTATTDTYGFATSQANALAGILVNLTSAAGGGTHPVVVATALAGTVKLQKNNERKGKTPIWIDLDDDEILNTTNIQAYTASVSLNWVLRFIGFRELQAIVTNTSGTVIVSLRINAKGG